MGYSAAYSSLVLIPVVLKFQEVFPMDLRGMPQIGILISA